MVSITDNIGRANARVTRRNRRALISGIEASRSWQVLAAVILVLLVAPVGVVALGSAFGVLRLPFEMHVLAGEIPVLFRVHMAASAIALLLAPVVILVRRRPDTHRMLGRVLGAFVVAGGLTALPVAIFSHSGGMARAGFFMQGLAWMTLFALGWAAILNRQRSRHRTMMLAMTAVTTGAVWFRIVIGSAIWAKLPFEATYAAAAWLAWMIPLTLALYYRKTLARTVKF